MGDRERRAGEGKRSGDPPPLEQLGDVVEGSPRQVVGELFGQRN